MNHSHSPLVESRGGQWSIRCRCNWQSGRSNSTDVVMRAFQAHVLRSEREARKRKP